MAKKKTQKKGAPRKAGDVIRETWSATLATLTSAEQELERQVRALMKKNKINPKDAADVLKQLRGRLDKQRKRALKELDARLKTVQSRLKKEQRNVRRMVNDAVQATLATFNIPSRQEVAELTRKVEELSKKIDSFRR